VLHTLYVGSVFEDEVIFDWEKSHLDTAEDSQSLLFLSQKFLDWMKQSDEEDEEEEEGDEENGEEEESD
jgi:hypothetical protein